MEVIGAPEQASKARSLSATLFAITLILGILYVGRLLFITLVTSVILAFILEPAVAFFERFKLRRVAASFVVCSLSVLLLYLAGLGVWSQAVGLWEDLPSYSRRITELVDAATGQIEAMERAAQDLFSPKRNVQAQLPAPQTKASKSTRRSAEPPLPPPIQEVRIRPERSALVEVLYSNLRTFYDVLLMASFVPFLVYFMLSWRDHVRRSWLGLFEGESRDLAARAWEGVANVARAYVVGNFLLGILLSVASGLFFWFLKLPYWQIIGPVSGFLSLIPYIGLPLAVVPPFFAALPIYGKLPAYLIIGTTVALFHLLGLNLLYPKMVGARVHLNPLVVTIALMTWYMLWGGAGLVLAIPITAGMKAVFENVPSMRGWGRLLGD